MAIQAILPLADGTYKASVNGYGNLELKTSVSMGSGYWVSDDSGVTIVGHLTEQGIADALQLMEAEPGEHIGIWTDTNTSITYVDRSYHFYRLETAVAVGKAFDQLAIWDCAKRESIRLVGEIEDQGGDQPPWAGPAKPLSFCYEKSPNGLDNVGGCCHTRYIKQIAW